MGLLVVFPSGWEEEAPRKPRGPCILLEVIHIRAIPADSENQVAA
jgi:hypothetical protein